MTDEEDEVFERHVVNLTSNLRDYIKLCLNSRYKKGHIDTLEHFLHSLFDVAISSCNHDDEEIDRLIDILDIRLECYSNYLIEHKAPEGLQ